MIAVHRSERGVALVVCTLAMVLVMALGVALVIATSTEVQIAANFRTSYEGVYAAGAALERALADLRSLADWNPVLDGSVRSGFADGPPTGVRLLPDGSTIDLAQLVNLANCARFTLCTDGQMDAVTAERPWGANNPRWRPYAYGSVGTLANTASAFAPSRYYAVVLVADDPAENDGDPLKDGGDAANLGRGTLLLRGESFGPRGMHRGIEATIARGVHGLRVLTWRERGRLDGA